MYRSIIPEDLNNDGVPEWGEYFKAQEMFKKYMIDDEYLQEFNEGIAPELEFDDGIPSPRGLLKQLSSTVLGEYWGIEDTLMEEMGLAQQLERRRRAQKIHDTEDLTAFKLDPTIKMYDKRLKEAKERARMANPVLDYALNIYGYTGKQMSFKNPIAAEWWRQDGRSANVSRLETGI